MFLSSWILSSSFPKTWGDEAPKLLPWDANDNHHCHLNLKCTLVSGPHHDYPWKLIILSQHQCYHWSLRPLPFLIFQSLSVSCLFPRPPSTRGGLRPAGVCSSRHSHNHQHSPAPQYHYLSSPQNHHSQSLSRFSSAQQAQYHHHCSCQLKVHLRSASPLLRNLRLCSGSHLRLTHCQGPAFEAEHAKGLLSPPG